MHSIANRSQCWRKPQVSAPLRWLAPSGPVRAYGKPRRVRGGGSARLDRPDGLHSSALQGSLDGRQLGTVVPACASFRTGAVRAARFPQITTALSQPSMSRSSAAIALRTRPEGLRSRTPLAPAPDSDRVRSSGTRRSQRPRPRSRSRNPSESLSRQASQGSCPLSLVDGTAGS